MIGRLDSRCRLPGLVCTALLAVALAAPARAEEGDSPKALAAELKAEQKKKEGGDLTGLLDKVVPAHNGADAAGKKVLQDAVGAVLKDRKASSARSKAAEVLGLLDDPEGAFKQLKKALPGPKDETAEPYQIEALKSVAALKPHGAVATLLKLAPKGKNLAARAAVCRALGEYGEDAKQRVKILATLVEVLQRTYEAEQSAQRNPKGGGGTEAWKELGGPLVEALNKLTGRSEKDAEAWLALWKEHKKKPAGLFPPAD